MRGLRLRRGRKRLILQFAANLDFPPHPRATVRARVSARWCIDAMSRARPLRKVLLAAGAGSTLRCGDVSDGCRWLHGARTRCRAAPIGRCGRPLPAPPGREAPVGSDVGGGGQTHSVCAHLPCHRPRKCDSRSIGISILSAFKWDDSLFMSTTSCWRTCSCIRSAVLLP